MTLTGSPITTPFGFDATAAEVKQSSSEYDRAREDLYALHLASAEREWLGNDAARAMQID